MSENMITKPEIRELLYGPLCAVSSREHYRSDATGLDVVFTTTAREGATGEMVNETKRHFIKACQCLYTGEYLDAASEWNTHSANDPVAKHGDPRVNIFANVQVKNKDGVFIEVSINKFTEDTTAFEACQLARLVASCVLCPMNAPVKSPPPVSTAAARQALGAGEQRRVSAPAAPAPDAQSDSGTPHFTEFPSKAEERAAFGAEYGGKVVSFTAVKIERTGSKKLDANGNTQYEWQFYMSENHQHPSVYATLEFIKDEATQAYLPTLPTLVQGKWRVVCYVNAKSNGKVYFNVNKVEPMNGTPQAAAAPKTEAEQFMTDHNLTDDPFAEDADLSANVPPLSAADEIPF